MACNVHSAQKIVDPEGELSCNNYLNAPCSPNSRRQTSRMWKWLFASGCRAIEYDSILDLFRQQSIQSPTYRSGFHANGVIRMDPTTLPQWLSRFVSSKNRSDQITLLAGYFRDRFKKVARQLWFLSSSQAHSPIVSKEI